MAKPPVLAEVSADDGEDCGHAYVGELRLSRDEVLNTHGAGDLELYEKLLSDPTVRSTFWQRRSGVIARETKFEPGGPSAIDKAACDSLEAQLKALSWDRTTLRMLNGAMMGRAFSECMFASDGRQVVLERLKVRRARRFRFGLDGSIRLMRAGMADGERMPEQKIWCATFGAEDDDDPNGCGLGHWLYWPVWFKRNAVRFWALFLERFAMPTPIATVPAGTTDTERGKVMDLLDAIRAGGKGVKSGITLEFMQAMKDSGGDYSRFVELMDKWITTVNLTQTMTTDDGASRAQGEVHERMGSMVSQVDADLLCETFMAGPARWLTEWNYPGAAVPRVYRDFATSKDQAALAERDTKILSLGYRPTEERILETYGDGYVPVAPAATTAPTSPESNPTPVAATAAMPAVAPIAAANAATSGEPPPVAAPVEPAPAFAESLEAQATKNILGEQGWRKLVGPEAEAVAKLLAGATDLKDAKAKLALLATSEPGGELVESLARSMFAARLQANAELGDEDGTNAD